MKSTPIDNTGGVVMGHVEVVNHTLATSSVQWTGLHLKMTPGGQSINGPVGEPTQKWKNLKIMGKRNQRKVEIKKSKKKVRFPSPVLKHYMERSKTTYKFQLISHKLSCDECVQSLFSQNRFLKKHSHKVVRQMPVSCVGPKTYMWDLFRENSQVSCFVLLILFLPLIKSQESAAMKYV